MRKEGQITLFIIIGIFIVVGSIGVTYVAISGGFSSKEVPVSIRNIEDSIDDCLEQRLNDVVGLIGLGGGYVTPDNTVFTVFGEVSYGFKSQRKILPSLDKIESEIEKYIEESIVLCMNHPENIEIKNNDIKVKTRFEDDHVSVSLNIPFFVVEEDKSYKVNKEYKKSVPVRLKKIHELANGILEKQEINQGIPITFIEALEEYDVLYDFHDEKTIIYIIHDEKSKISTDITFNFMFAVEIKKE